MMEWMDEWNGRNGIMDIGMVEEWNGQAMKE